MVMMYLNPNQDRRRSPRSELNETAYISNSGSSTRCRLVNISDNDAALDVPDASFIPNRFQMMTEKIAVSEPAGSFGSNRIGSALSFASNYPKSGLRENCVSHGLGDYARMTTMRRLAAILAADVVKLCQSNRLPANKHNSTDSSM